jgi:hypothetical protein
METRLFRSIGMSRQTLTVLYAAIGNRMPVRNMPLLLPPDPGPGYERFS